MINIVILFVIIKMSRTYRNLEHNPYYSKPRTQKYRRDLDRTKEEILDVLGSNYLRGNNKNHTYLPTHWDDKILSASKETLCRSYFMERLYEIKIKNLYKEYPKWFRVNFNKYKNRFELGVHEYAFNKARRHGEVNCVYLPFCVNYKSVTYPAVIFKHQWEG